MSTIICPKCKKEGYLIKEKPRKKHILRRSLFGNKRHKQYESVLRQPKPILKITHNVKLDDHWKVKNCYLGVFERVVYKFRNHRRVDNKWDETAGEVLKRLGMKYELYSFDSKLPSDTKTQQEIANFFTL